MPWTYTLSGGNATITGYNAIVGGTTPTVPVSIDGFPVIAIGAESMRNKGLTSVTLQEGLVSVSNNGLRDNDLGDVVFPSTLVTLAQAAFMNSKIGHIQINHAINFGAASFRDNNGMSLTLNADGCVAYSATSPGLESFFDANMTNRAIITSNVTDIPAGFFSNCGLTSIIIPNSVTSIGLRAFRENRTANGGFTSVIIPNSVTSIGNEAFLNCRINSFTVSSAITTFGANVLTGTVNTGTIFGLDPSTTKDWWQANYTSTYTFEVIVIDNIILAQATASGEGNFVANIFEGSDWQGRIVQLIGLRDLNRELLSERNITINLNAK